MENFRNFSSVQPSYFSPSMVERSTQSPPTLDHNWTQILNLSSSQAQNSKDRRVLEAIKAALPNGEQLQSALIKSNTQWMLKRSHNREGRKQYSNFKDFALHAFSQGTPYEAAEAAQTLAATSESGLFDQILLVVDRVIFCDDDYMFCFEGLRCALSQGFLYSEAGQARRAWQTWRRAITSAQVLGLHKGRRNLEADKIWWMLYNLDRFFSLMLGMPYAIADVHCNMNYRGKTVDDVMTCSGFVIRLSQLTGRVIDHLQDCNGSLPTRSVDELGRELTRLAAEMPDDFWYLGPTATSDDLAGSMQWLEKIMGHLAYFQTDIALHLPYMLQSTKNPRLKPFRDHCIQSSRKFLKTYHQLRHPSNSFASHCRVIDSVSCTACIILLLSLWGFGGPGGDANDRELIRISMDIFKTSLNDMGDGVTLQSYHALNKLTPSQSRNYDAEHETSIKFTIPFFGKSTVTKRDFFPQRVPQTFETQPHHGCFPEPQLTSMYASPYASSSMSETQQFGSHLWTQCESFTNPSAEDSYRWNGDHIFDSGVAFGAQGLGPSDVVGGMGLDLYLG
jgi:hypothetical protein